MRAHTQCPGRSPTPAAAAAAVACRPPRSTAAARPHAPLDQLLHDEHAGRGKARAMELHNVGVPVEAQHLDLTLEGLCLRRARAHAGGRWAAGGRHTGWGAAHRSLSGEPAVSGQTGTSVPAPGMLIQSCPPALFLPVLPSPLLATPSPLRPLPPVRLPGAFVPCQNTSHPIKGQQAENSLRPHVP
eukprot:365596-Chlamydomonas_euryale.AAC.15